MVASTLEIRFLCGGGTPFSFNRHIRTHGGVVLFIILAIPAVLIKLAITRYYITDRRFAISHALPFLRMRSFRLSEITGASAGNWGGKGRWIYAGSFQISVKGGGLIYGNLTLATRTRMDTEAAFIRKAAGIKEDAE